jgi:hypothetical protein
MDLGIIGAVVMLAVWAVAALGYDGPGWVHLLLTAGVWLLIYRITVLGTRAPRAAKAAGDAGSPR